MLPIRCTCCWLVFFFFFLMIRRPPRSTLFPTRRSSDLECIAMRVARLGRVALVLTAAALLSCGEPPLSPVPPPQASLIGGDRKSTRLNSSHLVISYAVFCLKKKTEP